MKRKFFITSFFFIASISIITFLICDYFYSKEKDWLLDQQIEAIATGLISNDLNDIEIAKVDELISDTLFDHPRTILVHIYNKKKVLIYQSINSQNILGSTLPPLTKQIFTFESDDNLIRVLNFPLKDKRILQVGLLLDQQQIERNVTISRIAFIIFTLLLTTVLWTWFQSKILTRPIIEITNYISDLTSSLEEKAPEPVLPKLFTENPKKRERQEIERLLHCLNYFKSTVDTKIRLTKTTVTQMAHELKTPLTIIRNSLELLTIKSSNLNKEDNENIANAIDEIDHLSITISRFLDWSKFESKQKVENLYAIKLQTAVDEVLKSEQLAFSGREIIWGVREDYQLFSNPEDLRQLLRNIIDNGLKYSQDFKLFISLEGGILKVINRCPDIPQSVFKRMGEPFNSGKVNDERSIGLGLAWINSLCKRYSWNFTFSQEGDNVVVTIDFKTTNNS